MNSLHALVVDDDTQALETMGMILEMDNFRVSTAPSGLSALDRLERSDQSPPAVDFLVLDLDMANLSGIELLTEMRKRGYAIPVMVVTGFASKGTVVELLRQGVADFLDKPLHMEEFRSRVHRLADQALRMRKGEDPLRDPRPQAFPYRAATVLDLGRLGLPYALRRRADEAPESNLVLAARKPHGFDLLIADVEGADAESFYVSVLIKTYFDRWRSDPIDGLEFLATLNGVVLGGALVRKTVRAALLRVDLGLRRIQAFPSGYPMACFTGLGKAHTRILDWEGEPLGIGAHPGSTVLDIPYESGDRIFLAATGPGNGPECFDPDLESARARESITCLAAGTLDEMTDSMWAELAGPPQPGVPGATNLPEKAFLLGLELP